MAKQKSSAEKSPASADPMLFGVSMPLSMTKAKATEVASAWRECLTAMMAAAKTKMKPEKSPPSADAAAPTSTVSA